ncbi:hypothetical protein ACQ143_08485 [Microbacterium sp. MC2]
MLDTDQITIRVLLGHDNRRRELTVTGQPAANAASALVNAIRLELGRAPIKPREGAADNDGEDSDEYGLVLCGESPDDPSGGIPVEYIAVPPSTTFSELRRMVGPRPFSVTVFETGFGGDGVEEFVTWFVEDLAPIGAELVELYGYAEIARRIGSATRRRRYREARLAARSWLIEGGEVPAVLRRQIQKSDWWWIVHLKTFFDLGPADAKRVMDAVGYRWNAKQHGFFAPPDSDAVN